MARNRQKSHSRSHKQLHVAIVSDCDPDRPRYGGGTYDMWDGFKWRGVREGVVRAREIADDVAEETGIEIPLTWCVRSDDQMHQVYGDQAWLYREYEDMWTGLAEAGDEITWHAHVWRWDDEQSCWYQEIEDDDWSEQCLRQGYLKFCEAVGGPVDTSRMGWEFHNNHTMQIIDDLGIDIDISAVPDWWRPGEVSRGSKFHCYCDWRGTPAEPYHPSSNDYRVPAANDDEALSVWEFPLSTFRSAFWSGVRKVRGAMKEGWLRGLGTALSLKTWRADQSKAYATIKPTVFRRLLADSIRALEQSPTQMQDLITAFHPDELIGNADGALYSGENFRANLSAIIQRAREREIEAVFTTVSNLRPEQ